MNKKGYTLIFMLLATILNLLLLSVFFIAGFVLLGLFMSKYPDSSLSGVLTFVVFIVSIGATFLIYNAFVKFAVKKWDLENKIYPFFAPKNRRKNNDGE